MELIIHTAINLTLQSLEKVWVSFTHNWPFLLASVVISVALRLYVKPEKSTRFLTRYRRVGVLGATAVAVTTPFCSCGTTAVILGMVASTVPWAPIVAFMVASPLTSPQELVYSAGLFGWPFAIAFFASSILLGLLGGLAAEIFESRGWLVNQARFNQPASAVSVSEGQMQQNAAEQSPAPTCACEAASEHAASFTARRDVRERRPERTAVATLALETSGASGGCGCGTVAEAAPALPCGCGMSPSVEPVSACGCGAETRSTERQISAESAPEDRTDPPVTARQWIEELYRTGRQLLVMFLGFAFIGYLLNGLIPAAWVTAIFGSGRVYGIPLAATLGLPLYVNTEGSLPLVRALMDSGMSQGAALAFLITGAGTSFGAVAGALTIARWRVIALVVGTLWVGAIALGFLYDFLLAAHLF
jgi:uncharacterized membrane protein YraQ (UPF0718 family)